MADLAEDWHRLNGRIATVSAEIEARTKQDGHGHCQRLMAVPGIGPIIAGALAAAIGNGNDINRRAVGSDFERWLISASNAVICASNAVKVSTRSFIDRQSGKIYWHSEFGDNDDKLPDDIDDGKYIAIPDKRGLDLGRPLVLDFAREFLPDDYDQVHQIFNRRGAYRRFKDLLVRRSALERWYDFSNKAEEAALRKWGAANGIDPAGP